MAEYQWSAGKPIQTDSDEFEWSAGKPFIVWSVGVVAEEDSLVAILFGTIF